MSDQTTPPIEEPTAPANTPATTEGTGTPTQDSQSQVNYEQRYKDLQAEFTRTRQQMQDEQYRAQLAQEWLSQHGYALPDDEPEPEPDPSPYVTREEFERINQRIEAREQAEQEAQRIAQIEAHVETKLIGLGIPEKTPDGRDNPDREWIVSRAIILPPADDGTLDVQRAHDEYVALQQQLQKQWMDTKRAPRPPGNGQQATQTKNVDDMSPEELVAWQVERLQSMER